MFIFLRKSAGILLF